MVTREEPGLSALVLWGMRYEVHILPPGLLPGKGWLRRHSGCSAYPASYEERTGPKVGLLPIWGTCPFPATSS